MTNKSTFKLEIDPVLPPKVLFLGNGMMKLGNAGIAWKELIQRIKTLPGERDVSSLPMAMQPEAVCGVDVEEIRRKTSSQMQALTTRVDPLLSELVALPFDAIITTNYSYEIEEALYGSEWTEYRRKQSLLVLNGSHSVNHNTFMCTVVETKEGRCVPVFHIHGELGRKYSMILSYYSYAKALARLVEYNKTLGRQPLDKQLAGEKLTCRCWLDYFIMGEVVSVGFGLDLSEVDVWWALERKAREIASHGRFIAYVDVSRSTETGKQVLLDAMNAECRTVCAGPGGYEDVYRRIIEECKAMFS